MKKPITIKFEPHRGLWRATYRKNGLKKDFYSSEMNERKARAEITQKIAIFEYGVKLDVDEKITIGHAIDEFLKDYKMRVRITSYNRMTAIINAHLTCMRKKVFSDIVRADWQHIIDKAYKNGATSPATLKGIQSAIRSMCKFSASKGWISDNDVPLYFQTPHGAKKKGRGILTQEELQTLLNADDNWYIEAFKFIVLTGLRRGELCALKIDRDFDGDSITLREAICHDNFVVPCKSESSERTIYLGERAKKEIKVFQEKLKKKGYTSKFLFSDPWGRRIQPRVLGNEFRKWRNKHGIERTLHELRHTHASYSLKGHENIDLDLFKTMFGHSEKMNTLDVYVHELEKSDEEKLLMIEKLRNLANAIDKSLTNT